MLSVGLSLRKNVGYALVGNLFYAASQYIVLLIFIKIFTKDDVGMFIYASAFTAPLMLALEMQLRNFYITDIKTDYNFSEYFSLRCYTNVVGILVLSLAALFLKRDFLVIILLVTLIKLIDSQIDLIYGVYQKNNSLNFVAYSRIIRGICAILIVGASAFLFGSIFISIFCYFLCWIILYFAYERYQVIRQGFLSKKAFSFSVLSKKKLKTLLYLCIPMFLSIFIDKYYLNYPRLVVEDRLGLDMLAIFGSLLYFKSLGGQFISSIAQSAIPNLTHFLSQQKYKSFNILLVKMISSGITIGLILTLCAYLGGAWLIALLYTPEYALYQDVLVVILLGATVTFSYIFIATALTCLRKQWVKLPISIISFVILFISILALGIDNLIDVSKIVLYVECFTFFLYYGIYIYFIRKKYKKHIL